MDIYIRQAVNNDQSVIVELQMEFDCTQTYIVDMCTQYLMYIHIRAIIFAKKKICQYVSSRMRGLRFKQLYVDPKVLNYFLYRHAPTDLYEKILQQNQVTLCFLLCHAYHIC
jgi:hypothetical protein